MRRRGFSLIEIIVAIAILGIGYKLVMSLSSSVNKSQEIVSKQVTLTKVVNRIWDNVLRDNAIIPPFDPKYGLYGEDQVFYFDDNGELSVSEDILNEYFDETDVDKKIYGVRCYSNYGIELDPPKADDDDSFVFGQDDCFYLVKFFKVRVPDKNFFSITNCSNIDDRKCSLSRIPMSNYYAQIQYYYNKIHKQKNIVTKLVVSSLKTDVIEF